MTILFPQSNNKVALPNADPSRPQWSQERVESNSGGVSGGVAVANEGSRGSGYDLCTSLQDLIFPNVQGYGTGI